MRKIIASLFCLIAISASAQFNATWHVTNSVSQPVTNAWCNIHLYKAYPSFNGGTIVNSWQALKTDTNGNVTFSNLIPSYSYIFEAVTPYSHKFETNGFPANMIPGTNATAENYEGVWVGDVFAYLSTNVIAGLISSNLTNVTIGITSNNLTAINVPNGNVVVPNGNVTAQSFIGNVTGSASSVTGIVPVSNGGTGGSSVRAAQTNTGWLPMSAVGGGNYLNDMLTAVCQYPWQPGFAYGGGHQSLFFSDGSTGTGTNVWGNSIAFFGGIEANGNPYWQDIPNSFFATRGVYWGFGQKTSSYATAWPNGANHPSLQPYWEIVQGNPYTDGAGINIRSAVTNDPGWGPSAGTDSAGNSINIDQFGWQLLHLTRATSQDGTGSAISAAVYNAPGNVSLTSSSLPWYWSINGGRSGDTTNGQIPGFVINPTNWGNLTQPSWSGWPYNQVGVWAVYQPQWAWAFGVDINHGHVQMTNGQGFLEFNSLRGYSNAPQSYLFGYGGSAGQEVAAVLDVNVNACFSTGGNSSWTFDFNGSHRMGFVQQSGQYTGLYVTSGAPLSLGHITGTKSSDLLNVTNNSTFVENNDFYLDQTSYNAHVANGLVFDTAGQTITVKSGTNAKIGTATANGTTAVTVNTTAVTANSLIFVTEHNSSGGVGAPYVVSQTAGTGFTFKSVSGDTGTVGWFIVELQ